jgi:hypothetical protein
MFLNALKNNDFLSYFFFLLLAVGFSISVFNNDIFVSNLSLIDLKNLLSGADWLYRILFLFFWLSTVFWINRLMVKYKILDIKGHLPVFLYMLTSFAFWQTSFSLEIILSLLFLLFLLEQLMIVFQNQGRPYQSLNLGLLFGSASLFYFPVLLIFPWAIFSLSVYKTMRWRDYIFPLFGLVIPFYLYSTFQFFNDLPNALLNSKLIAFELPKGIIALMKKSYVFLFTLNLLLIVVFNSYIKKRTQTIKNRVFHDVLLLFFVGVIIIIFFGCDSTAELSYFIFPLTFLGAMYFDAFKRKWFFDIMVIGYLVLLFL